MVTELPPSDFFTEASASAAYFQKIMQEGMLSLSGIFGGFVDNIKNSTDAIKSLGKEGQQAIENMSGIKDATNNMLVMAESITRSRDELLKFVAQAGNLALVMKADIKPDAFNAIAAGGAGATASLVETTEQLKKIASIIPGLSDSAIIKLYTALAATANPARQFEAGLLASAGASGELGDLLKDLGNDLSGLQQKSVQFAKMTEEIGNANNISAKQVGTYAAQLRQIPGALSVDPIRVAGQELNMLSAAIKVAAGTGQSFQDVFNKMNNVYENFGTTGEKALLVVSRISSASQNLKMPMDIVTQATQQAASNFQMFGDNSQAALNVLEKFGPALKDSGLGPKAITQITTDMANSVANLGMAQRAFLSQTSGGVGGLQGAFQIEKLKREGKMDEVQAMVESSLKKQFGGKIATLDDATKSQAGAAQYAKQIQLLTSGPTALAKNEGEAERILDVMAKGGKMGGASPQKSLESAVETGNKFQERNADITLKIANFAEKSAMYGAITANELVKKGTGREDPLLRKAIDSMRSDSEKSASQEKATTSQIKDVGGIKSIRKEETVGEAIMSGYAGMGKYMKDIGSSAASGAKDIKGRVDAKAGVGKDLKSISAPKAAAPGKGKSAGDQENVINVEKVCPDCLKKTIERIAIKIVDGRLEEAGSEERMYDANGISH